MKRVFGKAIMKHNDCADQGQVYSHAFSWRGWADVCNETSGVRLRV